MTKQIIWSQNNFAQHFFDQIFFIQDFVLTINFFTNFFLANKSLTKNYLRQIVLIKFLDYIFNNQYQLAWPQLETQLGKKLLLQNVSNFYQRVQNWFWKQEMELSKQEMELFLLFPDLRLKNFFYKMFLNFINEFKAGFENRKWNYPNRKWNYPNRKWNYFSHFQASDQKTSFTKHLSFDP